MGGWGFWIGLGTTRRGGPARVQIFGRQQADGSTRRRIAVHSRHLDTLDAAATRELAAALTYAADEIERLGPSVSAADGRLGVPGQLGAR